MFTEKTINYFTTAYNDKDGNFQPEKLPELLTEFHKQITRKKKLSLEEAFSDRKAWDDRLQLFNTVVGNVENKLHNLNLQKSLYVPRHYAKFDKILRVTNSIGSGVDVTDKILSGETTFYPQDVVVFIVPKIQESTRVNNRSSYRVSHDLFSIPASLLRNDPIAIAQYARRGYMKQHADYVTSSLLELETEKETLAKTREREDESVNRKQERLNNQLVGLKRKNQL